MTKLNNSMLKYLFGLFACVGVMTLGETTVFAQCATSYSDSDNDGVSVHAWVILTDNYTQPGNGCAPSGWNYFTHTYNASVSITSPSGRTVNPTSNNGQQGGTSGAGTLRDDNFIGLQGEFGDYTFSTNSSITCSFAGAFYSGNGGGDQFVSTPVQHNYPANPLPAACRIASFFDAVRNLRAHHAEDVVFDNGQGGQTIPALGTPITAMEGGVVDKALSGNGPASAPYPQCQGAAGNYVKIRGADGYFTIYFHMTPSVNEGDTVTAGQVIGTLDNSGCQTRPHLHVGRKDPSGNLVNFTIPCVNPLPPTRNFVDDESVSDIVPDIP